MNTENNRKIAEFMQIPKCDRCEDCGQYKFGSGVYFHPKDMPYDTDWNWIMRVVEKIESLGYIFQIWCNSAEYFKPFEANGAPQFTCDTKLQATYAAVIQFIDYYNGREK